MNEFPRTLAAVSACLALTHFAPTGLAQTANCQGLWEGEGLPGVDRRADFAFEWNHDANPQTPAWLVVGGSGMSTAGNVNVRHWAVWDGQSWRSLLGMMPPEMQVLANGDPLTKPFAVDQESGELWQLQGDRLAHRDPTSGEWTVHLLDGVLAAYMIDNRFLDSPPRSFVVQQGVPFVMGSTSQFSRYLFRWNGSAFVPVASLPLQANLKLHSLDSGVYLSSRQNQTVPPGPRVWRLEGDSLVPLDVLGAPIPAVSDLHWFQNQLIALAGPFNTAPECYGPFRLLRWAEGTWQRVPNVCLESNTNAQLSDGVYLYRRQPLSLPRLSRWDGATIATLDVPLEGMITPFRDGLAVIQTGADGTGGPYPFSFGGRGVAYWDRSQVAPLGSGFNAPVTDILADELGLVVSGSFTQAGSTRCATLAIADGDSWQALPALSANNQFTPPVRHLALWQGNIAIAQERAVRMLTNDAWQDLGSLAAQQISGLVVYRGDLYRAHGRSLARWDGQAWTIVALAESPAPDWFTVIASIKVLADRIAILGSFDSINGQPIQGVALWSPESLSGLFAETLVDPLGGPDWIRDIELFRGSHYAAGYSGVYRLDGSQWVPITTAYDTGVRSTGPMLAFADRLFVAVAPWLQTSRGLASYLVEFDGQAWRPSIGYSVARDDQTITSLSHHEGQLLVGGSFTTLIDVNRSVLDEPDIAFFARYTPVPHCDPIDFNNDGTSFDPTDIDAFLSVFSEGPCSPAGATCNDIDFNNDCSLYDPEDIDAFMRVFSEGTCLP